MGEGVLVRLTGRSSSISEADECRNCGSGEGDLAGGVVRTDNFDGRTTLSTSLLSREVDEIVRVLRLACEAAERVEMDSVLLVRELVDVVRVLRGGSAAGEVGVADKTVCRVRVVVGEGAGLGLVTETLRVLDVIDVARGLFNGACDSGDFFISSTLR